MIVFIFGKLINIFKRKISYCDSSYFICHIDGCINTCTITNSSTYIFSAMRYKTPFLKGWWCPYSLAGEKVTWIWCNNSDFVVNKVKAMEADEKWCLSLSFVYIRCPFLANKWTLRVDINSQKFHKTRIKLETLGFIYLMHLFEKYAIYYY